MSSASPNDRPRPVPRSLPGQQPVRATVPVSVTPLLGRDADVAHVRELLDADITRIVTLTGPGGIGKTRLAHEVGKSLEADYAHGARFVSLASLRDPALVASTVAQALGVRPVGNEPAQQALIAALRNRHLLLVLDNLEHVVSSAAPMVGALLAHCPRIEVLITSRAALRISGEQLVRVEPLDLPSDAADTSIDRIGASGAVQLFVQRAQAIQPGVALTDETAADLAEICRALDGVPLAIELASARMSVLSLPTLRSRLTSRLHVLTGTRRDAPPRHQTMRAAIAWSYDLLPAPEQQLFRSLAVFEGGFSVEGAKAIGNVEDAVLVEMLASLIDQSLARRMPESAGDDRFEMLDTIREFGLEQLAEQGEDIATRDAHAAWYMELARTAASALRGAKQAEWLNRLEAEHDNIRGVFAWLTQRERIEEAMDLAATLWPFWRVRRHTAEARARLDALLARSSADQRTIPRANVLVYAGNFAREGGDPARALAMQEEALAIFREHGDDLGAASVLRGLAWALADSGHVERANDALRESANLYQEAGHRWGAAVAIDTLGEFSFFRNDYDQAREYIQEALAEYRAIGDNSGSANALAYLGMLDLRRGDTRQARLKGEEGLDLSQAIGDRMHEAQAMFGLASAACREGDFSAAEWYLTRIRSVAQDIDSLHFEAYADAALGVVALAREDIERAGELLRGSVAGFQRLGLLYGMQHGATICLEGFASLAHTVGDRERAARFLGMSDGILERIGLPRPEGDPFFIDPESIGAIQLSLDDPDCRQAWIQGRTLGEDDMVAEALAFIPPPRKAAETPASALPDAAKGLSPRELEVLRLMADGLTNHEVADALFISPRTSTSHITHIFDKLGVTTRTAAVAYAIRNGLA